ncbi:MAG: plastocyanin/azurin family copper-binding protein [Ignavibacteriaceae bacterium]|nr:plastocyanin/azurin family copper-binding protein [Ignavibacteriaceae bacterium]
MEKNIKLVALLLILFMISAIIVIPGCKSNSTTAPPSGGGSTPGPNEVWMQNIAFNPASKTISVGTTITWTNKDNTTHTATSGVPGSPDGLFNSGNLSNGGTFSFKFTTAGTFKYYCLIHGAMMTATMTVQ